jgi:hypothetical protein
MSSFPVARPSNTVVRRPSRLHRLDILLSAGGIPFAVIKTVTHARRELLLSRFRLNPPGTSSRTDLRMPGETRMKIFPLRSAGSPEAEPDEFDFPLPVADPSVRPMHRECVLKGCSYRSRFLFGAGWVFAVIFLVTTLAIGLYGARSQEALLRENALLYQQIDAQREQSVTRSPAPVPAEKEPVAAPAPSPPPKAAPQVRKSVQPKKPNELPPVPESEKWWNRP